jgi:Flp pilus assembly pilin Flp
MNTITQQLKKFAEEQCGATAIEYALIALFVATATIGAFTAVGVSVATVVTGVAAAFS